MRIVFMGTPGFAARQLDALVKAGHEIACVYSQPPRPAGRGKKDRKSAVQMRAEALGLPVRHPVSLKGEDAQAEFIALNAELAVVVAYGLILPRAVLDAPKRGCWNIHASLLPRWRGAAPIHRAIMAGDVETGVGIMQMETGLDTGPVLLEDRTPILPDETSGKLQDRLAQMGAALITEAVAHADDLTPRVQSQPGVTYAHKINKVAEARIDWTQTARQIDCTIRGLSPDFAAWTTLGGKRLKLLTSRVVPGQGQPGAVLEGLTIACGTGAVQIGRAQLEGKNPQSAAEFLNGITVPPGTVLGTG